MITDDMDELFDFEEKDEEIIDGKNKKNLDDAN